MANYLQGAFFIAALSFWIRCAAGLIVLMTDPKPQPDRKRKILAR
jgi:hypothetical protein